MTNIKYHKIKMKGDPSARTNFIYEKNNLELKKEKGLREFWEGKVDGVSFVYTPSIMGQSNEITFLIFEDTENIKKIEDKAWMEKAYWRVVNSIGAGDKWRKELHKAKAYNKNHGYQVKWKDNQISIKELKYD
tara:strand:+ start:570 stop:968 length:399 start_codon:yes stop_codon:yes gene_type:complete